MGQEVQELGYHVASAAVAVGAQQWDWPQPLAALEPIAYAATVVHSKGYSSYVTQVFQVERRRWFHSSWLPGFD